MGPSEAPSSQGDGLEDGSREMRTCSRTSRLSFPQVPPPTRSCQQLPSLLKKQNKQKTFPPLQEKSVS